MYQIYVCCKWLKFKHALITIDYVLFKHTGQISFIVKPARIASDYGQIRFVT